MGSDRTRARPRHGPGPWRHDDLYLLEKARDAAFAREGVERLIGVFGVAPVDDHVVRRALGLAWPDFEDAVCAAAAEASACDALVTRDPDRYPNAPLPLIDPAAALSWLTEDQGVS